MGTVLLMLHVTLSYDKLCPALSLCLVPLCTSLVVLNTMGIAMVTPDATVGTLCLSHLTIILTL